jgi:hypothetical protein
MKQYKPLKVGGYYKEAVLNFFQPEAKYRYVKVLKRKKIADHGNFYYKYLLQLASTSHICSETGKCSALKQDCATCNAHARTCYKISNARAHAMFIPVSALEGLIHVGI